MKKIVATCIICSLVIVLGLSSIAYAKGDGYNPVDALLGLFSKIENSSQIETGGDALTHVDQFSLEYDEEQVAHVSLTASGTHFNTNTTLFVRVYLEDSEGWGLGSPITIFDSTDNPHIPKTIEFNAKHWELILQDGSPGSSTPGDTGTVLGYAYTITYPPAD